MESHTPTDPADQVRAALAAAGITLPPDDIAFLAAQQEMLARTIAAVAQAAPK
jgi:hypothetical protein